MTLAEFSHRLGLSKTAWVGISLPRGFAGRPYAHTVGRAAHQCARSGAVLHYPLGLVCLG
jgi:hypothetical protein